MIELMRNLAQMCGVSMFQMSTLASLMLAGACITPVCDLLGKSKGLSNDFAKKKDLSGLLNKDGMQLSKDIYVSAKSLFEHLVVFGPTGSGKSSSLFITNLLQEESFCNSNSSLVIMDLKGEMYNLTSSYQKKLGRDIKIFAPFNNDLNSIHYNPLDFCRDESDVVSLAKDILTTGAKSIELRNGGGSISGKDSVWLNMAAPLFASILIYVYKLPKPKNNISYALRLLLEKDEDELERMIFRSNNDVAMLQYKIYQKASTSGPTTGSIQVTLASNVQTFITPQIEKMTSYTDFNFEDMRRKKTALYIVYPPEKAFDLAPITAIFFSQLFNRCKELNDTEHLPMFCLYDEFSNCGQIPMFSMYSSILRSYRISLICCLQDKTQLKNIYGEASESIFNNLRNLVLFGGEKDSETLKSVESLCGNKEVLNISTTINNGSSSSTRDYKSVPLMSTEALKNMKEDEILIMLKNQRPIISEVNPYYKSLKYLNNAL